MPASKLVKSFLLNCNYCLNALKPPAMGGFSLSAALMQVDIFYDICTTKNTTMGRGDKKTKKGKIFKGSFGKSRPASEKKTTGNKPAEKKES